jgi:hypothetical protein
MAETEAEAAEVSATEVRAQIWPPRFSIFRARTRDDD